MNQRIIGAKLGKTAFFLLICSLCSATLPLQAQKPESGVALISDAKTGTILVRARLNQQLVTLILDTGASHSIFDARAFGISPDQLQMARRYYNGAVRNLNTMIQSFPSNLVAGQFKFEQRQYFEIEEPGDRAVPKVSFQS